MGKHATFIRGTAETMRRLTGEAEANYSAAEAALTETEDRDGRESAREAADLGAKFPALNRRS